MTAHRVVVFLSLLLLLAAVSLMAASEPACGQVVPATAPGVEAVIANIDEGKC